MILDWNIYNERIDEEINSFKNDFNSCFFDAYKEYIGNRVYFFLEKIIPLIDFDKDDFTLRASYECAVNKNDERNILFNLRRELEECDCGDMERLSRLKEIFIHSMGLIDERIKELEDI